MKAFDLIADCTPVTTIRLLAQIEDDSLVQKLFAFIVCETAGGLSEFPTKSHRLELAREFNARGVPMETLAEVLNLNIKHLKYGVKR